MEKLNIEIRAIELTDASALQKLYANPEIYSMTRELPGCSQGFWEMRIKTTPSGTYNFVAVIDDVVVGHIEFITYDFYRRRHVGYIPALAVNPKMSHKGIGRALMEYVKDLALNWMHITRLELTVYEDNEPAINLYKSCGFAIEGTYFNAVFRNGKFENTNAMAWLAPEIIRMK